MRDHQLGQDDAAVIIDRTIHQCSSSETIGTLDYLAAWLLISYVCSSSSSSIYNLEWDGEKFSIWRVDKCIALFGFPSSLSAATLLEKEIQKLRTWQLTYSTRVTAQFRASLESEKLSRPKYLMMPIRLGKGLQPIVCRLLALEKLFRLVFNF